MELEPCVAALMAGLGGDGNMGRPLSPTKDGREEDEEAIGGTPDDEKGGAARLTPKGSDGDVCMFGRMLELGSGDRLTPDSTLLHMSS